MKNLIVILTVMVCSLSLFSQENTIKYKYYGYEFIAIYDTANYCSDFKVTHKGKTVYEDTCIDRVISIKAYNLKGEDHNQMMIDYYTGGAHCCFYTFIGDFNDDRFKIVDSIMWGNGGYEVKDLDNDAQMEIVGSSDIFAYAFTNYAETRFPTIIYKYEHGRLKLVNREFTDIIEKEIADFKKDVQDFVKNGYECPQNDTDTFNTDAGSLKTMLAPIVADYHSIGKVQEGYDFIDKMYKCSDKEKYKDILKNEFKFK